MAILGWFVFCLAIGLLMARVYQASMMGAAR